MIVNLESWLTEKHLRPHKTTKKEIQDLLGVAQRDMSDAAVPGLSSDRRFLIAYEAALTLATIPLYCVGYETYGKGHHWLTFRVLPEVIGAEFAGLADYSICVERSEMSEHMTVADKFRKQRLKNYWRR